MNKTVNINLAGLFFHIDEDAYLKLQRYLEAIKRSFTDSQGRSEIVSDIESRIAELFNERTKSSNQVIGNKEVEEIITIMGQPEDYLVDDDIFEDEPHTNYQRKTPIKKLFRDTENSYISGVSSGLGHYLGIDAIWIRLIWVLLLFGLGTGFLIYILLWIFVPEARSTSDKLQMTGKPINISNIEKKIRNGFDNVSENLKNVDIQKHSDQLKAGLENVSDTVSTTVNRVKNNSNLKNSSTSFFDTIGTILMTFVKIIAKFIGFILMFTGIVMFISTTVGIMSVGVAQTINIPGLDFVDLANNSGAPIWLISLIAFLFIGIIAFFIFYLGLKMVAPKSKSIGNPSKYSLLILWLASLIALVYLGINQGMSFKEKATLTQIEQLHDFNTSDTLKVSMNYNDMYSDRFYKNNNFKTFTDENGEQVTFSQDIRLIVKSTRDSIASIKIKKSANGFTFDKAKQRADAISYGFELAGNELLLNNYFLLSNNAIEKGQEIEITLYMPIGSTLYADGNTYNYHRNTSYYLDILENGQEEHYLTVAKNKLICNDCNQENTDNSFEIDVNINEKNGTIKLNSDGIKTSSEDFELIIDSNGVKSTSENLKININENEININSNSN
jgi:phage shock protein PspC (stress-responsive transcriptional regulator)